MKARSKDNPALEDRYLQNCQRQSVFKCRDNLARGFGIIEILISLMVITSAVTGMLLITGQRGGGVNQVVGDNQRTTIDADTANRGIYRASEMLEKAEVMTVNQFNSIISSNSSDGIFTDKITVTDISPCRKDIISSVNWSPSPGRTQTVELSSSLAGMQEAGAMGGDCNVAPPSTNWQTVVCKDSDGSPTWDFPQDSGIPATGIDVIKRGTNRYAVITSQGSASGKRDFWIVNVKDRTILASPQSLMSALDLGPGFNDLDVAGNYAFVANNATSKQFFVIDISNLAVPDSVASISLNAVGGGSEGQRIFYYNNKVYMGTNRMISYKEFQIFDVTNPASPTLIPNSGYDVEHNIYSIVVRNEVVGGISKTLAYLAISDSVGDKPKLIILDVTNPSSVTLLGSYNPSPNSALYGTALYVIGKNVYLGRQRATLPSKDLLSINVSNPSLPILSDSELLGMGSNTDVRGMVVSGPLLFVSTSDNNKGFQVWNISNPSNIINVANCKYPQEPMDLDFDGDFIYVTNRSQAALRIIYDNANPFPN